MFDLDPILIDSDSDDDTITQRRQNNKNSVVDSANTNAKYRWTCDCKSVNCTFCLNEKMREIIIKMYKHYPIIENLDKIYQNFATKINKPTILIKKLILQYQRYTAKDSFSRFEKRKKKLFPFIAKNTESGQTDENKLHNLEVCQLRRVLLSSKPSHLLKVLKHCCATFKHKSSSADLIGALSERGGIKWRRITHRLTKKSKLIFCEDMSPRIERLAYIQKIQKFRLDGREIIYINEINPLVTDKKALIIAAACANGPITSVYMKHSNPNSFFIWLSDSILSHLSNSCVFILDASTVFRDLHEVGHGELLTSTKQGLISWLEQRNIYYETNMYKTELYDLVKRHANEPDNNKSTIEKKLNERGHDVLFIPKNNRDLDPFEFIWTDIKLNMIASDTKSFNMNKEFASIAPPKWKEHFRRVCDIEKMYLEIEQNFDRTHNLYNIDNECANLDYFDGDA